MKKGFTLIELLAVIVILAIIALIATPIVLDIIEDSKNNASLRSAENYLTSAKQSIANHQMNNPTQSVRGTYTVMKNGNLCEGIINNNKCNGIEIKVQISGKKIIPELITIGEDGDLTNVIGLEINGKNYAYNNGSLKEDPTKTVYINSFNLVSIGNIMDDPSKYTTDPTTLENPFYIKHILNKNNEIIKSYSCVVFNNKEVCVRGGKDENGNPFYGYAEDQSDYTGNMLILKNLKAEGVNCELNIDYSYCNDGYVGLDIHSDGNVQTSFSVSGGKYCLVNNEGNSYCRSREID